MNRLSLLAIFVLPVVAIIASVPVKSVTRSSDSNLPRMIIWSWQHDDDLRLLKGKPIGVAYYAGTVVLGRDVATFKKRLNRLVLPDSTMRFPVFRLENAHHGDISAGAFAEAARIVADYCAAAKPPVVQIDFDAELSDRDRYLAFLQKLKAKLPSNTRLSITALSSWCLDDKWLQKAPVDETVAMMFSMGKGKADALRALTHERLSSGAPCAQSIGVSVSETGTNEELIRNGSIDQGERIYAFSPLGWTGQRYNEILSEVNDHE